MSSRSCIAAGGRTGRQRAVLGAVLLACAWVLGAPPAQALRAVRVYEVDAGAQSDAAIQQAMRQVLVRATGQRSSASDPALAALVTDAPKYLKSWTKGPRGELQAVFDGAAVEHAIEAAGRAVWDVQRPFTLVVLSPPPPRGAEDAMRAELERTAAERGLLISLVPLPLTDATGAPLAPEELLQSAQRHGGDQLLVGRADGASAEGAWRWTLYTSFSAPSWSGPLAAGIDGTVEQLAPPPGTASLAQAEQDMRIEVNGVGTLVDYANVGRILTSLPGVRRANLVEASGRQLVYDLTVRGGPEALDRALAGSSRLVRTGAANARIVYDYRP